MIKCVGESSFRNGRFCTSPVRDCWSWVQSLVRSITEMLSSWSSVLVFLGFAALAVGFPDGAPVDACVKPRPNQPNHGRARPQQPETNPYQIIATSDSYGPGSQITVTIQGQDTFKGFLIQARDIATNEWIGSWHDTPNTKSHPECSAITHADPKNKQQATFIWRAPLNSPNGKVYFTGTVLKEYSTFWSDMVNVIAQGK